MALAHVRTHVSSIINEFGVTTVGVKAAALSLRRNQMKEIVAGNVDHLAVGEKWQSLSDKHREALLASYVSNMRGY